MPSCIVSLIDLYSLLNRFTHERIEIKEDSHRDDL